MIRNKKGETTGEQTMGIWFLALLLIIGAGLSIGILIYFGKGHDFRQAEAGILNYKIRECLFMNNVEFIDGEQFFSVCGLNRQVLADNFNETRIAIRICDGVCGNDNIVYQIGSDFSSCDFEGKNREYMQCVHKGVRNGEKLFDVIVGSNHKARRAT